MQSLTSKRLELERAQMALRVSCPYCGQDTQCVTGKEIYPHRKDLYSLNFYLCKPCNAYCGCHKGTLNPLGSPANVELREARMKAHRAFDELWKDKHMPSRTQAYKWLSEKTGVPPAKCHIAMFDTVSCENVVSAVDSYWENINVF